jgi:SM-20-related protein
MSALTDQSSACTEAEQASVFAQVAADLHGQSWSVIAGGLPMCLAQQLLTEVRRHHPQEYDPAGIGRSKDHMLNTFVRRDQVRWIEGATDAEQAWQKWANGLQIFLNRRLFLGLFSFESHFAHYGPGGFYKKHLDAFKPNELERGARRELSLVTYLNPAWGQGDGGELLIYDRSGADVLCKVAPAFRTLVVFLSTEVPHEVLPANRDRYSIAGWFRLNGSVADRPDPPQ